MEQPDFVPERPPTVPGESVSVRDAAERAAFAANAVPALLAYLDTNARYVWVNAAYLKWFACPPGAIVERHASEVLGAAAWENVRPYVERALAGEEVTFDNRLVFEGHAARDVRATYVPHRDGGGRVQGFVAMVSDITEMKAAETALRQNERMLAQAQAAAQVGSWELAYDEE